MERRARAKKPSKISVTHYPNLRVKPDIVELEEEVLELYPVYYYITIKRRTIHRVSLTGIGVEKPEDIERCEELKAEARIIKGVCKMYLDDLDNNSVNQDIIEDINPKTKDRFVAELNAYIKYWTDSVAIDLWKIFHSRVKYSIVEKMESVLTWRGLSEEEQMRMTISIGLNVGEFLERGDYIFLENNTEGEDRELLYAWYLIEFLDRYSVLEPLQLTRYTLEKEIKIEAILEGIQKNREEIKRWFGSEKLASITREECTRIIELVRYWQKKTLSDDRKLLKLLNRSRENRGLE